jgi:hypothetical protein
LHDHYMGQTGEILNNDRHVERPVLRGDRHGSDCTGNRYRACASQRVAMFPASLSREVSAVTSKSRNGVRKRSGYEEPNENGHLH